MQKAILVIELFSLDSELVTHNPVRFSNRVLGSTIPTLSDSNDLLSAQLCTSWELGLIFILSCSQGKFNFPKNIAYSHIIACDFVQLESKIIHRNFTQSGNYGDIILCEKKGKPSIGVFTEGKSRNVSVNF